MFHMVLMYLFKLRANQIVLNFFNAFYYFFFLFLKYFSSFWKWEESDEYGDKQDTAKSSRKKTKQSIWLAHLLLDQMYVASLTGYIQLQPVPESGCKMNCGCKCGCKMNWQETITWLQKSVISLCSAGERLRVSQRPYAMQFKTSWTSTCIDSTGSGQRWTIKGITIVQLSQEYFSPTSIRSKTNATDICFFFPIFIFGYTSDTCLYFLLRSFGS